MFAHLLLHSDLNWDIPKTSTALYWANYKYKFMYFYVYFFIYMSMSLYIPKMSFQV